MSESNTRTDIPAYYSAKHDSGKLRAGIMFRDMSEVLTGMMEVLSFGARKYKEGSWKDVPDAAIRYEDAFFRHYLEMKKDPNATDPESHLPHGYHAIVNLMFMMHFMEANNKE
jgi:hypothetical protein